MPLYFGKKCIEKVGMKFDINGVDTSDATIVSSDQMLSGVTAYGASGKVTGTIPRQMTETVIPNNDIQIIVPKGTYTENDVKVEAVPTESKDITTNGTYTPQDGKYFSSVSVNITGDNFDTQSKTVTPTQSQQTVSPDSGYDGLSSVTVEPIPSEYVTTSDATAVASDIMSGKTAYVNGVKVEGTFSIDAEITAQEEKIAEQDTIIANLMTALEGKASNNLDTSDATATAEDIATGKTAYIDGVKVTGTHECSSGSGSAKTTKTINIDWSGDAEQLSWVKYISNNEIVEIYPWNGAEVIEADNGVVVFYTPTGYYSDNFITLYYDNMGTYVLVAKQDGETLYAVSSSDQV